MPQIDAHRHTPSYVNIMSIHTYRQHLPIQSSASSSSSSSHCKRRENRVVDADEPAIEEMDARVAWGGTNGRTVILTVHSTTWRSLSQAAKVRPMVLQKVREIA